LSRNKVPHLIELDHHRVAWRLGAAAIDIAAHPAQHRLRRGAEQVSHGVERQAIAIQADGGAPGRFGRVVSFKARELVAAPLAAPSLPACNEAGPDQAGRSGIVRMPICEFFQVVSNRILVR
jgi:hypothetical protein